MSDGITDARRGSYFSIEEKYELDNQVCENQLEKIQIENVDAIEFLNSIREYERESGNCICYDDRTSEELYNEYKNKKKIKIESNNISNI